MAKHSIYTIAVLDDKEYDGLHKQFPNIKENDLKDSLGFANQDTGEAYVRRTNVAKIDATTMQHELQELLSKNSEHEDAEGIRWKKGRNIINTVAKVASAIPGPWQLPALATAVGTQVRAVQKEEAPGWSIPVAAAPFAISRAVPAIQGFQAGKELAASQGAGALGQVGAGIKGAITGTGTGTGGSGVSLISAAGKPTGMVSPAMITNLTDAISAPFTPSTPSIQQNALGNVKNLQGPVTAEQAKSGLTKLPNILGEDKIAGTPNLPQTPPQTFGEKMGEFVTDPKNIIGAGSLLASAAPKPPVFEMPSSVGDIKSKLLSEQGGLTSLGKQAQLELGNILKSKPTELYPTANDEYYNAALRRTRENYSIAQQQLDAAYNNAGMLNTGEHLAQKAKLQEELARTESALAAETEQRRFELARTTQYQAIQDSLNVDKSTMDDLVGLSGLDVQTAAMIYGAKVEDVNAIRQALGTVGANLLSRGTGFNQGGGGGSINISPAR